MNSSDTAEKTWMGLSGSVEIVGDRKIETHGTLRVNGVHRVEAMIYSDCGHAWAFEGYSRPRISPKASRVSVEHILDNFRS